jgi:hypothetical protein
MTATREATGEIPALARIQRANLILGVALTALAGILWGVRGTAAAAVGAALACADFYFLGLLGARALARVRGGAAIEDGDPQRVPKPPREGLRQAEPGSVHAPWALGLALIGKMAALFALVFVAIRVMRLAVLPFALGFSVFVVSILLVGTAAGKAEAHTGSEVS